MNDATSTKQNVNSTTGTTPVVRSLPSQTLPFPTRLLLESMIAYSDNDAAGAVYARVGDAGMSEIAERGYDHPEALVSTEWVAAHLDDPGVRVVESDEEQVRPLEGIQGRLGVTAARHRLAQRRGQAVQDRCQEGVPGHAVHRHVR